MSKAVPSQRPAVARELPANMNIAAALAPLVDVPETTGDETSWHMLLPAGEVIRCRDDRVFNNPDPQAVIDHFKSDGMFLMIDVNHDSIGFDWDPPAFGWIEDMELRDGAIWGDINWTDLGVQSAANKHYRYLSPAFYDDNDNNIIRIVSAGLVNQPAMNMPAVARAQSNTPSVKQESDVDKEQLEKLRKAYDLPDDADAEAVMAAVLGAAPVKPEPKAESQPGVIGQDTPAGNEPAAAPASDEPGVDDLEAYVPRADYDAVSTRLAELEASQDDTPTTDEVEAAVDSAIQTARIAPASRKHYLNICSTRKGFDAFKALAASSPKLVADQPDPALNTPNTARAELTPEEIKVCRAMGVSKEKFLARKSKSQGA